jgi:N-carbamoylputrescine amidase
MAQLFQIVILAGLAEKDAKGRIFASHLVVGPEGVCGIYRKIHIAPPENDIFNAGNSIPVFKTAGVILGIQLCYDVHFPELSTRMAVDGADIIFMPHASPRGTPPQKLTSWLRHLTARAFDNSVFIIACNQNGDNQKGLHFPGVAVVMDPSGQVIDKNISGEDGLVISDLKTETLNAVRNHRMRYFLPNRRPEIY